MTTPLMMLDSGAFSVWNKGDVIDFDAYLQFCIDNPGISYYVNLDVIPGVKNGPRPTTAEANIAARKGLENYEVMCSVLPRDKVIPVFHQGDPIKWLEIMLESGIPYIGISPANDQRTASKLRWMKGLRGLLFKRDGTPRVRTHGFAVTSYDLMREWQWHSVDSASWGMWASYGQIAIPRRRKGEWDYSEEPDLHPVSLRPKSSRGHGGFGLIQGNLVLSELVHEYLEECGVGLGKWETRRVKSDHKLLEDELWCDRAHHLVYKVLEKGVATDFVCRCLVNLRLYPRAEAVLPVDHIYYAGHFGLRDQVEPQLRTRLLTFALMNQKKMRLVLEKHLIRIAKCKR